MRVLWRAATVVGTVALLELNIPAAAVGQPPTPKIAVMPFDATPSGRLLPPTHLGTNAAQLMIEALVSADAVRVFDGRWLPVHGGDEASAMSALRTAAADAGIDYLLMGTITRFSTEQDGRTVGGFGLGLPVVGGYRRRTTRMAVSIVITLIDVRSGAVAGSTIGEGQARRRSRGLGGVGIVAGIGARVASGFGDALVDEATSSAVHEAAEGVVAAAARLTRSTTPRRGMQEPETRSLPPQEAFDELQSRN